MEPPPLQWSVASFWHSVGVRISFFQTKVGGGRLQDACLRSRRLCIEAGLDAPCRTLADPRNRRRGKVRAAMLLYGCVTFFECCESSRLIDKKTGCNEVFAPHAISGLGATPGMDPDRAILGASTSRSEPGICILAGN